ncbi:MAG: acyl-CoA thioesterase [Candidatus Helarchaeota archaeon]|nr:acyl-CoA thioesterase [Candidatus Helarchaeota archaeon]
MKYSCDVEIKVRYSETDQMGLVYHANYIIWFNIARDELMRQFGVSITKWEGLGYLFPVVEVHCYYKYPARYGDVVIIKATTELSSVPKIQVNYEVLHKKTKRHLATGKTVNVITTKDGRLLLRMPDILLGKKNEE